MPPHVLLSLLALLYALSFLGRQLMAVMIEPIKAEFSVSDTTMGLLSGLLQALVLASLALPAGRLADRFSRTHLLALASLIWAFGMFASGMASSFYWLLAARLLIAACEAPFMPTSLSLIADLYPPKRRSMAISCFSAAPTLCIVVALAGGAWLVEALGWRSAFYLCAAPALLMALLLALSPEPKRGLFDLPKQNPEALSFSRSLQQLAANRAFIKLIFACGLATLSGYAFAMWNTSFLVRSHQMSLTQAGVLAGFTCGLSGAIGMLCGGWLGQRFSSAAGKNLISSCGIFLGICSLSLYLLWPQPNVIVLGQLPVPYNLIGCALYCFFSVWWVAPCFSRCTELVSPQTRATAMALQTIVTTLLGVGLGPLLTGLFSDLLQPWAGAEALRYALLFSGLPALLAIPLIGQSQAKYQLAEPVKS